MKILHRVSFYTFEAEHEGMNIDGEGKLKLLSSKSKPFKLISKLTNKPEIYNSIKCVFNSLIESEIEEPLGNNFDTELPEYFEAWKNANNIQNDQFEKLD